MFSLDGLQEISPLQAWWRKFPGALKDQLIGIGFHLIVIAGYLLPLAPILVPVWLISWFFQYLFSFFR